MEELNHIICQAFTNYHKLLQAKGKGDIKELNYINIIDIINRFLQSDLALYLNERDLSVIKEAISCIQFNSCFVSHFDYEILNDINKFKAHKVRITEDDILRINDHNILRIKA